MENFIKKAIVSMAFATAFLYAFAIPADDSATWLLDLLESKLICVAAASLFVIFNKRWKVYGCEER